MRHEEYVRTAIKASIPYEKLPESVKAVLSHVEWRGRVRDLCIQQGDAWGSSMAHGVCSEQEYYEQLVAAYKSWARLYPYHMADYVARVLRVSPFKYYSDVLFLQLKEERPYDRIPNFTAADALRVTGVGRNEYIAILNACKSKRLMWRVNRGAARDLLPRAPREVRAEPWWKVAVVNVGEAEFRELSPPEAALLRQACGEDGAGGAAPPAGGPLPPPPAQRDLVSSFDPELLQSLYLKGLVHLEVPVQPEDRLDVPPLEGFVSNRSAEAGDQSVDPLEPLLYSLFLANSSRLDQRGVSEILGLSLERLLPASSLAVRLGFAARLPPGGAAAGTAAEGAAAGSTPRGSALLAGAPGAGGGGSQASLLPDAGDEDGAAAAAGGHGAETAAADAGSGAWGAGAGADGGTTGGGGGGAMAVVVDSEATSYLMMGALSPGLKRHSVTLFEGGRVGGAAVIDELVAELAASAAAGEHFEGDMVQLTRHIRSLGILLDAARAAAAAQGQPLELLRKESLAGLDPRSAAKVLRHTYSLLVPVAPAPGPPLPLNPLAPGAPALYGPTPEAGSPWLQLGLYAAARCGPPSLVVPAGRRVWRLPHRLEGCTHALLWGWRGGEGPASGSGPLLVEGSSLLCTLNELLCRTAVMAQPLLHMQQLPAVRRGLEGGAPVVSFVDVPLPLRPLPPEQQQQQRQQQASDAPGCDGGSGAQAGAAEPPPGAALAGSSQHRALATLAVDRQRGGELRRFEVPEPVVAALGELRLRSAVGWLRMVRLPPDGGGSGTGEQRGFAAPRGWLPLSLHLGVPLFCPVLCQAVCSNMAAAQCLTPAGAAAWRDAQRQLQLQLWQLVAQFGAAGLDADAAAAMCGGSDGGGGPGPSPIEMPAGMDAAAADVEPPAAALLFDGADLLPVDLGDCLQGAWLW